MADVAAGGVPAREEDGFGEREIEVAANLADLSSIVAAIAATASEANALEIPRGAMEGLAPPRSFAQRSMMIAAGARASPARTPRSPSSRTASTTRPPRPSLRRTPPPKPACRTR
ncbi:hypothetical protein ZWY2020_045654 [Hordeum vulgare]|nr:hypothetical protein ZWY2020_045654 [Hordeum vulgare]